MTRRWAPFVTGCALLALGGYTASPAAASVTGPITVPGTIIDLAPTADGGLNVATVSQVDPSEGALSFAALRRIDPSGALQPAAAAPPAPSTSAYASIALTPDGGAITTYAVPGTDSPNSSVVASRALAPDGTPGAESVISTAGKPATTPGPVAVGPTGAAALTYREGIDAKSVPRFAYRAPGAATFLPSAPLDRRGRSSLYSIVLGPDGGGVVIAAPNDEFDHASLRVRRISPAGTLGKWLTVGVGKLGDISVAGTFTGSTFVLAVATNDLGETIRSRLFTSALAKTAKRFTRPQKLRTVSNKFPEEGGFDLVATTPGRVALITGAAGRGLQLWEGRAMRLRATQRLTVSGPSVARLRPTANGGLAVYWLGAVTKATDVRALTAERAAGARRFAKPALVPGYPADPTAASFGSGPISLTAPRALPDGRTAIAYNPSSAENRQTDGVILTAP